MAWKDILIHVGDTKASEVRLKASLALAKISDARITGLYVVAFPPALTAMDDQIDPTLFETILAEGRKRAEAAEKAFRAATKRTAIRCDFVQIEGNMVDVLSRHGRYADLIVVGQNDRDAGFDLDRRGMPDEVILSVGRPVLVVPRSGSFTGTVKQPLVAWNGSSVAARALHDAMPFLERAKRADVVRIAAGPPLSETGAPEGDIAAHLAHHGIKARVETLSMEGNKDGEALLAQAKRQGADLIVMGAYGHWRWRELVLGGVTAHVLAHADVPVLMSH